MTATGTIHDIGYRHYEGSRLGRGYVVRSLFVHNLRAVYGLGRPARAKVMPFLIGAIMLVPAMGSVAVLALTKEPDALIRYAAYTNIMQVVVAIFLATQAPVIASRELRHQVVPLYFSRPVGHLDFVLAKYGAFVTALFILLAVPVTILYTGVLVTKQPELADQTLRYLKGLVGCGVFALVLGAFGMVIAVFTPRRGFGVAAVMAAYLLSSATVNIVQGLAMSEGNTSAAGWAGLFTPFNLVDGVQVKLLGAATSTQQAPPGVAGGMVFTAACVVVVATAIAVLHARYRKAGLA